MRFAIYTLGCKVNQYETQALETELRRRGHELVPFPAQADAYLINTCTVTAMSDHKSRAAIRRARKVNPAAAIGVCGCYAQTAPEAVAALGVDVLSGTGPRIAFLDAVERAAQERLAGEVPEFLSLVTDSRTLRCFERLHAGGLEGRTRAMLKIEDGCTNFCSYCIIPYARGPVRSLCAAEAAEEARGLRERGYREIVLTGIEISSWGRDLGTGEELIDLIETVCAAVPGLRVRLGSLEPRTITEDFCRRAAALPNLCPHFHLSMQSGCDETLRRMNRKYDTARYLESVTLLRRFFEDPAITTDLIVGFPGETPEEFSATLAFVRRCAFSAMHIFPYSRRRGTAADRLPEQVPSAEKERRAALAAETARELEHAYLAAMVGKEYPVLFEECRDGLWRGHAPNYVQVECEHREDLHNILCRVRVLRAGNDTVFGEICT